jgi:hypothetical protein
MAAAAAIGKTAAISGTRGSEVLPLVQSEHGSATGLQRENAVPFTTNVTGKTYASSLRLRRGGTVYPEETPLRFPPPDAPLLPAVAFAEPERRPIP